MSNTLNLSAITSAPVIAAKNNSKAVAKETAPSAPTAPAANSNTLTLSEIGKFLAATLPAQKEEKDSEISQLEKQIDQMLAQYKQIDTYSK